MTTSKERVLNRTREDAKAQGRAAALDLASRAPDMDETAIIAEEANVPMFEWGKDYSKCPAGSPIGEIVEGELQIFTMITPVNTAHYPGSTPNTERSLFSLCHTTDPKKAKGFVSPLGISGLYALDECCTENGGVYLNLWDKNESPPSALPERWEYLGTIEEVQG